MLRMIQRSAGTIPENHRSAEQPRKAPRAEHHRESCNLDNKKMLPDHGEQRNHNPEATF